MPACGCRDLRWKNKITIDDDRERGRSGCDTGRTGVKSIYYGWLIVVMAMVISALLVGSTFASFGVFVVPVAAELMLSRADMNTALIFKNLGNAIFAPIIGRLLDRIRTKLVMIVCAIVFAASFVTLGLSHSLWLSALVMGIGVPIAYLGAGSLTNTLLIARWFTAHRARAMLLAGLGGSIGSLIGAPAAGLLVEAYGWRVTLVIMGVAIGAILLAIAMVVRVKPGADDIEAEGTAAGAESAPKSQTLGAPAKIVDLLRTTHFWTMGLATAMALGANQALIVSLVPLGIGTGLSTMQAASLMSILGGAAIVSALSFSIVADKINRVIFLAVLFVVEALVNAALLFDQSYATLMACAAALGMVGGTLVHSFYALLADRFGAASFGTVRGATFTLIGLAGMIAVRFSGEVFDRTGAYDVMFQTFIVSHSAAAALMLTTLFVGGREAASRLSAFRH
jgi:predicted MFS family arabinose efflux permease